MKSFSSFTFFHQSFSMPGKLSFDWFGSIIWRLSEGFFFLWFCGRFQVKKKKFFHNFLTIMSFGVIGVFISTTIISFGTWWVFPKLGFEGLTARDYLGEILFIFVFLPAYICSSKHVSLIIYYSRVNVFFSSIQPLERSSPQLILFALYRFLIFFLSKDYLVLRVLLLKL